MKKERTKIQIHYLKIKQEYFNAVKYGEKKFEVRKNDRDFKVDDTLVLKEINETGEYTGRRLRVKITYILEDNEYTKEGYCILSIEKRRHRKTNIQYPDVEKLKGIAEYAMYKMYSVKKCDFTIQIFKQIWGNTATGFDLDEKYGTNIFSGQAMTEAYTTVFHEKNNNIYVVFFDGKPAYTVHEPSERFFEDLKNCTLASLKDSKDLY